MQVVRYPPLAGGGDRTGVGRAPARPGALRTASPAAHPERLQHPPSARCEWGGAPFPMPALAPPPSRYMACTPQGTCSDLPQFLPSRANLCFLLLFLRSSGLYSPSVSRYIPPRWHDHDALSSAGERRTSCDPRGSFLPPPWQRSRGWPLGRRSAAARTDRPWRGGGGGVLGLFLRVFSGLFGGASSIEQSEPPQTRVARACGQSGVS